ncbi:MAG: B12-binding domain-containing radical SAM protein [Thermoplasmatota archaeon]
MREMPLRYDMPVYRPPVEAWSLILQPTIGCPHNRCTFCFAYKGKRFRVKRMEEIKADIAEALREYGPDVRRVFLADGNTIFMKTEQILEMLGEIRRAFPNLIQTASYAGAKFVLKKSPDELRRIREAGLSKLYMGVESGDQVVLERVCKGIRPGDTLEACLRLKEAGFQLSTTIVLGLGGLERSREHALRTAELLNKIQPHELRLHTLMLDPGAPLWEKFQRGEFTPCGPQDIFRETRAILEKLELDCLLYSHGSNYLLLQGKLPEDKAFLLDTIDTAFTKEGERVLRGAGVLQSEWERAI